MEKEFRSKNNIYYSKGLGSNDTSYAKKIFGINNQCLANNTITYEYNINRDYEKVLDNFDTGREDKRKRNLEKYDANIN